MVAIESASGGSPSSIAGKGPAANRQGQDVEIGFARLTVFHSQDGTLDTMIFENSSLSNLSAVTP